MSKFFFSSLLTFFSTVTFAQTINDVASEINKTDIQFKTSALAMAIHETGNGKSKAFKHKLNAFGFVKTVQRKQVTVRFTSIEQCVSKFKITHDAIVARFKPTTEVEFLRAVCRYGYAEDRSYFKKVHKYFKKSKEQLNYNGYFSS